MKILMPGARVQITRGGEDLELAATVLKVEIAGVSYVQYLVAWWDGVDRMVEWLEVSEFTVEDEDQYVTLESQP